MAKLLSPKKETYGMSRSTLRLFGLVFLALGAMSRGILQTRVLGVGAGTARLLEVLELSGGMTAAAAALALEALESCAVPIFAVLLVDGFEKTGSFRNYLLRLLALAAISEVPYNFAISKKLWDPLSRNPVFSLALCLVALYLYRSYGGLSFKNILIKAAVFAASLFWAAALRVQYGIIMLLVVTTLWAFRERSALRNLLGAAAAICCCVGRPLYMFSPFGFLLAHFYNGQEGVSVKRLHYALYPLMLLLIGIVGTLLFF